MNPNRPAGVNADLAGALWMILAGGAFTIANVAVRSAAEEIHPFVIVFLRSIIAVPLFAHILLGRDFKWNPDPNFRFHLTRGVLQASGLLCLYVGISLTPLATVAAIGFVMPIVSGAGAILFLGKPSKLGRWFAVLFGFAGVLIILRPGLISLTLGALLVVAYAVQQAASNLSAKVLVARSQSAASIVAWMTLISAPVTLVPALAVWSWPSAYVWGLVAVNAVLSTIAHVATVQAYKCADITVIDPLIFFRMVLAAAAGFVFYNEVPDIWTWGGSIVILIAGMILSRDERSEGSGTDSQKFLSPAAALLGWWPATPLPGKAFRSPCSTKTPNCRKTPAPPQRTPRPWNSWAGWG
jgi:drug/metabolite transporter (DMT)-like permease